MKKIFLIFIAILAIEGCDMFRGDNPPWRGSFYLKNYTDGVIYVKTNIVSCDVGEPYKDRGPEFCINPGKTILIAQSMLFKHESQISPQVIVRNLDEAYISVSSDGTGQGRSKTWVFSSSFAEEDSIINMWDCYVGVNGDRVRPPMRKQFRLAITDRDLAEQ